MLFSLLYNIVLLLLACIAAPKMLYQYFAHGKYKKSLGARFGKGFPEVNKKGRRLVWIHAVSVGETKAVAGLAKLIKEEADHPILLISSITETGHAEAQRSIPYADYHVYLPIDISGVIDPIVKRVKPDLVIVTETDLWYHFLKKAKECGARTVVVNGKVSLRSFERLKKFSFFAKRLYPLIDRWIVQNEHYKDRFLGLGVNPSQVFVTANLKFDQDYPKLSDADAIEWKKRLGIESGDRVFVVGSTHDPEEEMILEVLPKLWEKYPKLKVLVVPRHPERFDAVAHRMEKLKLPYRRFSKGIEGDASLILVDSMGVLRKCLQIADIAFIGGSFVASVGGHNILEPCAYGVPVLFGPYMHSQPDLVRLVLENRAGLQVNSDDLYAALEELLGDAKKRRELGDAGSALVQKIKGSTYETWKLLPEK